DQRLLQGRRRRPLAGGAGSVCRLRRGDREPRRADLQPQDLSGDRDRARRARTTEWRAPMLTATDLFEDLGHALATDYFFLREQLTDEQLDVLRRVRLFVDDEVLPVIGGYWERAEMPWPLIQRLGELGGVREDID